MDGIVLSLTYILKPKEQGELLKNSLERKCHQVGAVHWHNRGDVSLGAIIFKVSTFHFVYCEMLLLFQPLHSIFPSPHLILKEIKTFWEAPKSEWALGTAPSVPNG